MLKKTLQKVQAKALNNLPAKLASLEVAMDRIREKQDETSLLLRTLLNEQRELQGSPLQLSDREVAVRIFNGLIMYLDPQDIAITPHIVFTGIWERWVTKAWLSILKGLKADAVVLDIGANNGYFGMLAAHQLDTHKAKVILFEPNPHLLPYIQKTLSVNWLNENSALEALAISDKDGTAKLNILKDYTGSSSLHTTDFLDSYLSHKMKIEAQNIVEVKTSTVDTYCKQNKVGEVDLVIMDIEGFEEKAYKGMRKTVANSPNMIFMLEFTKDGYEKPKELFELMKKDFGHVYTIADSGSNEGELIKPHNDSYSSLVEDVSDYVMLVFSKKVLVKK